MSEETSEECLGKESRLTRDLETNEQLPSSPSLGRNMNCSLLRSNQYFILTITINFFCETRYVQAGGRWLLGGGTRHSTYSLNIMQCWYLSLRAADVRELLAFGLAPALHCVRVGVITDHPVTPSPPLFTILVPLLLLMGPRSSLLLLSKRCLGAPLLWCNLYSSWLSGEINICILYSITIFQHLHNREM